MPFLSRIRINPLRAESRKLIASPRAMHGAVQGGLPTTPDQERTLWRLDADNPHRPHLYVLTVSKPDWTHLVEQAGWPEADGDHYAVADYAPLLNQLAIGREFAFRLTASPVQNTSRPNKLTTRQTERQAAGETRGFRLGHRTAAAQMSWFLTRTTRWGFDIPTAPGLPDTTDADGNQPCDVRLISRGRRTFGKGPDTKDARVIMHSATYEGRLRITDTTLLTQRLLNGIGPSKAYGCGLLTLAPLHHTGT